MTIKEEPADCLGRETYLFKRLVLQYIKVITILTKITSRPRRILSWLCITFGQRKERRNVQGQISKLGSLLD